MRNLFDVFDQHEIKPIKNKVDFLYFSPLMCHCSKNKFLKDLIEEFLKRFFDFEKVFQGWLLLDENNILRCHAYP